MTIGILFKVMHWPGANILIISSLAIFTFVFIPIYFFSRYRNPETKFNAIIHSTFMIAAAGLLFSLINLKTSHNVTASVESMDLFQDSNLEQLKENNAALYAEISHDSSKELEKFQEITAQLLKRMRDIKANLIAQSNKIPIEKAENMTLADVQHPNDMRVIHEHFEEAKGELSYDGFKEAVQQYNDGISDFDAANVIRPVDIEELQMTHTMLSVVLNELVDIEIQVLANENSYLSLSKGLVAKN
jgi:hypothetical protein